MTTRYFHDDPQPTGVPSEKPAPALRWNEARDERFFVWTAETPSVPQALRAIASLLDNDPDLMMLTVVNAPGEPVDPWCSIVQVTFSRCPSHSDRRN